MILTVNPSNIGILRFQGSTSSVPFYIVNLVKGGVPLSGLQQHIYVAV